MYTVLRGNGMDRYEKRLFVLDDILSRIYSVPFWHHHKGEMNNIMGEISIVRKYHERKLS